MGKKHAKRLGALATRLAEIVVGVPQEPTKEEGVVVKVKSPVAGSTKKLIKALAGLKGEVKKAMKEKKPVAAPKAAKGTVWTKLPKFSEMDAWLDANKLFLKRDGGRAWVENAEGKCLGEGRDRRRVIRAVRWMLGT